MDILYAWLAAIASGLAPLIIKASSKSLIKNPWLFNVLWVTFRIPLVMVLGVGLGGGLPKDWPPLIFLGFFAAGFYLFNTLALYKLDVTTVSPLYSLRAVFAVLLGVVALHEAVNPLTAGLMAVTVLMIPLTAYNERTRLSSFFHKPILLAVAAMASLAFTGYFANLSVAANGFASTILWQDLLALFVLLPTLRLVPQEEMSMSLKRLRPFMLLGLAGFVYIVTSTLAYSHNLALSSVIVSLPLSMVFAFVLSKRYSQFLETHTSRVYAIRFLGASVMVACAIWLSFLR